MSSVCLGMGESESHISCQVKPLVDVSSDPVSHVSIL